MVEARLIGDVALRDRVPSDKVRSSTVGTIERSGIFLTSVTNRLESAGNYSQFQPLEISYRQPFEATKEEYPHQVAAVIAIHQPDWVSGSLFGSLDSDSHVLISRRSATNSWGAGTWATPMGKIEFDDVNPSNPSLGNTILSAAHRELEEEIVCDPVGGCHWIAGSYVDTKTGIVVHTVVEEVGENRFGKDTIYVTLPDMREHDDIGWVRMEAMPDITPIELGTRYLFLTALLGINRANDRTQTSRRFQ